MIGTSGIVVPGNRQSFPPAYQDKSRLHYYGSMFNSLEVNSSFYKVPMKSTCERWVSEVPAGFRFTLKLWKALTHSKNLDFDDIHFGKFMNAAEGIGPKKGSILVQFPGKINFEFYNQVEQLLDGLQQEDRGNEWRIAVEFRSSSWYVRETYELLNEFKAALVMHDIPKGKNQEVNVKADFHYLRYHGPKGDYRGSYTEPFLREEARKIAAWRAEGKDVYVYFNNTAGDALANAWTLQKLSEGK